MIDTSSSTQQWHRAVSTSAVRPTLIGLVLLVVWLGGFGIWAALVPLDGAVMAPGIFVAHGENKQVQHFEGGIISNIHVVEGQPVIAGQSLALLDQTSSRAKLRQLVLRKYRLLIMQARLDAEVSDREHFSMPPALASVAIDPEIRAMFDRQQNELQSRRNKDVAEEQVLQKEIAGLHENVTGYESQVESIRRRMALFSEELKSKDAMMELRLARKPEVLALQRSQAGLEGDLGNTIGKIGDSKQKIARAQQQIVQQRAAGAQETVEELRKTESELDDVQEQIRTAEDVLGRTDIRSPVDGIVVKIHHHTQGGVVAPGAVLLEILPTASGLIIEARVAPSDISHVSTGQEAMVRLSTVNRRLTPMIKASVVYLSADAVAERSVADRDPKGRDSFVVRVALDEGDVRAKASTFRPTPGMPAEVYIKTGERTFFDYITRPLADTFSRSFREQ